MTTGLRILILSLLAALPILLGSCANHGDGARFHEQDVRLSDAPFGNSGRTANGGIVIQK